LWRKGIVAHDNLVWTAIALVHQNRLRPSLSEGFGKSICRDVGPAEWATDRAHQPNWLIPVFQDQLTPIRWLSTLDQNYLSLAAHWG
jgi:hypothetical protein